MLLWQIEAAKRMTDFINNFFNVESITFVGSMLDKNLLDVFSDVDMEIRLSDDTVFDLKNFLKAIENEFCTIFGYQYFIYDDKDTLRICFENGWRFDFIFIYQKHKVLLPEEDSFIDKLESFINGFWYVSVLALVKLWRGDHLIAAHLAMELCQSNIVVQMLLRDNVKNTNMHRFGDKEDVPILHSLLELNKGSIGDEVLSIIYLAAEHMERISESHVRQPKRTDKLRGIEYHLNPNQK